MLEALVVFGVGFSCLVSIDFFVFLQLDVFFRQLVHANGVGLLLEADLGKLLIVHLNLIFRHPLFFFLTNQVTIQKGSFVDSGRDFLLFVFHFLLHFLLNSAFLLKVSVSHLLLLVEIVATESGCVGSFGSLVQLLLVDPQFFLSCPQVSDLSLFVGLVLVELGLVTAQVFFSLSKGCLHLFQLILLATVAFFDCV